MSTIVGAVQRFPAALLPLLTVKADQTPKWLLGELAPTLDMIAQYLSDRVEIAAISQGGISAVANLYLPVPSGEYWWLFGVAATASNITAASAVQLQCGMSDQAGANVPFAGMPATTASVAGENFVLWGPAPPNLILRPGMRVYSGTLVDPGAGSLDLQTSALIARLVPG